MFIDVEVKWPGSVHDGRVFGNLRINKLLIEERLSMLYKEIIPGHDKIPVTLLGNPAYPLLPYCMKEFASPRNNEEVIFNNMLRGARNPIECAYGRLKARWQILNKRIDLIHVESSNSSFVRKRWVSFEPFTPMEFLCQSASGPRSHIENQDVRS